MIKKQTPSSDYLLNTSREYSIYVCSNRAIPAVEDGLKNGQRMALWLLRNKAEKIKTVALSGLLAAEKIYVHGETSANNAIGMLAAPYKNNIPLIDGIGQFGSRNSPVDGIGAPRYTEVRRSNIAQKLLYNDLEVVPLEDNYDGSTKQPKHFNPLVPLVLLNGVEGVAVGWSTMILPHSLKDIIDNTIRAIKGEKLKPMVPHYEKYDVTIKPLEENKWEISGKVTIDNTSTMTITEIPPGMDVDNFRKKLIEMEDSEQIEEFTEHSTDNICIEIRMKRGALKDWDEDRALNFLKLRQKVTQRIVVVGWGGKTIQTYDNPCTLIQDFVTFRLGVYQERFKLLLVNANDELLYWKLLALLFKNGFVNKLGTFANKSAMYDEIQKMAKGAKLDCSEEHINKAMGLPTYRWNKEFLSEINDKLKEIQESIKDYTSILKSEQKIKDVYENEVNAVKSIMKSL